MGTNESGAARTPADARLAEIESRFGDWLSADQIAQVKARIERTIALSKAMRSTPLTNADEPEIVFTPYRGKS